MRPHKPQLPRVSPWVIVVLIFLFIFWLAGTAYCQDSSQGHIRPNKVIYYDTMINCTALKVKRLLWGSKMILHTHYFYVRYTKTPKGTIDTRHARFYYPDKQTRIRLIWYTDLPQSSTDTTSDRWEVVGELKMQ